MMTEQPTTLPEEPEYINFSSFNVDGQSMDAMPEWYGRAGFIINGQMSRPRHWSEYVMIAIGWVGILMWAYIIITALINPSVLEHVNQCLAAIGN